MRVLLIQESEESFNDISPKRFCNHKEQFHFCVKMTGVNRDDDGKLIIDEKSKEAQAVMDWCLNSFGNDNYVGWGVGYTWIFLRRREDLMRFKLRWC